MMWFNMGIDLMEIEYSDKKGFKLNFNRPQLLAYSPSANPAPSMPRRTPTCQTPSYNNWKNKQTPNVDFMFKTAEAYMENHGSISGRSLGQFRAKNLWNSYL